MADDIAVNPLISSKKEKIANYLTYINLCFVLNWFHFMYSFYFHILRMNGIFQLSHQRRASFIILSLLISRFLFVQKICGRILYVCPVIEKTDPRIFEKMW